MHSLEAATLLAAGGIIDWLYNGYLIGKVIIGFSIIIFFHELGHFLAAKWVGIRVDRFAVGFGSRVCGFRRGEGFTFGNRPEYRNEELREKGYGETDYCFKALPIGGYVKMLGQDDIMIDEKTGEVSLSDDPRAFTSRPVGQRMIVVSAGVIFNLLFAAALLAGVFLYGKQEMPAVIGYVPPDSPASGKLQPGDEVTRVNGRSVNSFRKLMIASIVAGDHVDLAVERDGALLDKPIRVETSFHEAVGVQMLNVEPARSHRLTRDGEPCGDLPVPKKGDLIKAVNGRAVESYRDIVEVFAASGGKPVKLTVQRPDPHDASAEPQTVVCYQRGTLMVAPAIQPSAQTERVDLLDAVHILGMRRCQKVLRVLPGSPAEAAGFRAGDVFREWGTVPNPIYREIVDSIGVNRGEPIRVAVERDGKRVNLDVTPRRAFQLFGEAQPRVGVEFGNEVAPVIADITPDTPAAKLHMPRGSRILKIDGADVSTWSEVAEALLVAAGRAVQITYKTGADVITATLHVPSSVYNELGLTPLSVVYSINGQETIETEGAGAGQALSERIAGNPWAWRKIFERNVGRSVTIEFSRTPDGPHETAEFFVSSENLDPWQSRITYLSSGLNYEPLTRLVSAHGNPAVALWMGVHEVRGWIYEVYAFLRGLLVKRTVNVQHVAGPVGIVGVAVERAREGLLELMYFMAFLSVNLAVINFLPIPVMDGGLMVFLMIEKIKGKPLSLKTQMISTLVGLAAIIVLGVAVTFQDIVRLFQ